MERYREPRSDARRLGTLENIKKKTEQDQASGRFYISAELLAKITAFIPGYWTEYRDVRKFQKYRMDAVGGQRIAFKVLKVCCRDFLVVVKRRTYRCGHPTAVLSLFDIPQTGKLPHPQQLSKWFGLAEKCIRGDAKAVADGLPPMCNPSAAELQEALTNANDKHMQVSNSDTFYDQAQERVANLRQTADKLIKEAMMQLRFALRHIDHPSQRRIMRTYGFKFEHYSNQKKEETSGMSVDVIV